MAQASQNSSRAKALARRIAMSSGGKAALSGSADRTRVAPAKAQAAAPAAAPAPAPAAQPAAAPAPSRAASYRPRAGAAPAANSSRAAALARRKAMSTNGKSSAASRDRTRDLSMVSGSKKAAMAATDATETSKKPGDCGCGCGGKGDCGSKAAAPTRATSRRSQRINKPKIATNPSKAAALARRKAQSSRGKAAIPSSGMSEAQTARAANPTLSSRELAQKLRETRSTKGKTCTGGKCRPTGKVRKKPEVAGATDQPWKVGASETARGQSVTGTMVGRDKDVTGDEASTCRDITGTEYLGADVFREFCQSEPQKSPMRTGVSATGRGNAVTGNEVGRSDKVTGDEPGTCKNVTGTEYVGAGQAETFCGTATKPAPMRSVMSETRKGKMVTGDNVGNSDKVTGNEAGANRDLTGAQYVRGEQVREIPSKVRTSQTLRGGSVTGTAVGRSAKTTGDEHGACRAITGDDYVGKEQYSEICGVEAKPGDQKVGVSTTFNGQAVSGTMEGRAERVTGNEPGTCKAITGTPYFGMENYTACETPVAEGAAARMQRNTSVMGKNMTGQQPGIGGVMTGAERGACKPVSGTPYVGADQAAQACPATAAEPSSSDFPQAVGDQGWGDFSVVPPSHAAAAEENTGVTGSRYEAGHITGPFGMASGKVTGTEDARFGSGSVNSSSVNEVAEPEMVNDRVKSRITGEGMDAGPTITGDDWDRGDRVTGTEGSSATVRNPSARGPMNAMVNKSIKEVKNEAPHPVSPVTGSSGNYEGGSLVTYSGGARG